VRRPLQPFADALEDRNRVGALFTIVITALLVSQFSAVSESCVAKALRITDDDWAASKNAAR
jgi:hypothetical protein